MHLLSEGIKLFFFFLDIIFPEDLIFKNIGKGIKNGSIPEKYVIWNNNRKKNSIDVCIRSAITRHWQQTEAMLSV